MYHVFMKLNSNTSISHNLQDRIYTLYRLGIYLKGFLGFFELFVGMALYVFTKEQIYQLFLILAQEEIAEDPQDILVGIIKKSLLGITADSQHFAMTFLILHGAVKLALIYGLIQKKIWVYPVAIMTFIVFIIQQVLHLLTVFSLGLGLITVLNTVVVILIAYEYYLLRKNAKKNK